MHLVIFDIDGTLLNTSVQDAQCYAQTFNDMFGCFMPLSDRSQFSASTDSGLLKEVAEYYLGKDLTLMEVNRFKRVFFRRLDASIKKSDHLLIPNAKKTFLKLQQHPKYNLAIATGAWLNSALLKLNMTGINFRHIPLASADDSESRSIIIQHAINQSKFYYRNNYRKITYVGDRHWDYLAAKSLKIDFYGIGNDPQMKEINKNGRGSQDYGDNPFNI